MNSYLFTLNTVGDGIFDPVEVELDAFYGCEGKYDFGDVDWIHDWDNDFHPINIDKEAYDLDAKAMESLKHRSTAQNGRSGEVYHVKSEVKLDRYMLETLIIDKKRNGDLKEFLLNSKL